MPSTESSTYRIPFTGHTDAVGAVAISELDGRPIAISGGSDSTVRVWDLGTGDPVGDPFTGHTDGVLAVAVGELDRRPIAISGGLDSTVRVWDLGAGRPVGDPFTGHTDGVLAVAVGELHERSIAISGGFDSTVRVWDLGTGANPRVIRLGVSVLSVTKPKNDFAVAGHRTGLTALRI